MKTSAYLFDEPRQALQAPKVHKGPLPWVYKGPRLSRYIKLLFPDWMVCPASRGRFKYMYRDKAIRQQAWGTLSYELPGADWHRTKAGRVLVGGALQGKHEVAVAGLYHTRMVTIDLDDHDHSGSHLRRLPVVLELVQSTGLPYAVFKTPRGLHVTVFYRDPVAIAVASDYWERGLMHMGLSLIKGAVELYPRGKAKVRLPCTKGSTWVDEVTLQPKVVMRGPWRKRMVDAFLDWLESQWVGGDVGKGEAVLPAAANHRIRFPQGGSGEGVAALGGLRRVRGVRGPWEEEGPQAGDRWEVWGERMRWCVQQEMGLEEACADMLAWWHRCKGGQSTLARNDWEGSCQALERDCRGFLPKLLLSHRQWKNRARKKKQREMDSRARHELLVRVRGSVPRKWQRRVLAACKWVVGLGSWVVSVHSKRWIALAGSSRHYQKLRGLVARVLRMGKVGGYEVGVSAQKWVMGWTATVELRDGWVLRENTCLGRTFWITVEAGQVLFRCRYDSGGLGMKAPNADDCSLWLSRLSGVGC